MFDTDHDTDLATAEESAEDTRSSDPVTSSEHAADRNGDGWIDSITTVFSDGQVWVVLDTDGDASADTVLMDTDQDGLANIEVVRNGADFLVSYDADGSGDYTKSEQRLVSRDELEAAAPDLVAELDRQFSGPDEPDIAPQNPGMHGDPKDWSENWFVQAESGFCVPASVAQIVAEYGDFGIADESAFVELAVEQGLLTVNEDGTVSGMSAEDAAQLLTTSGVPATLEYGTLESLTEAIDSGRAVMVAVDSGEYWNPSAEGTEDDSADHCVVVSGIDTERGVVYLSDPGHPDGDRMQIPIEQFNDAWQDSGNAMIVCDEPAPDSDSDSSLTSAFDWATNRPWALLPVVLGGGSQ